MWGSHMRSRKIRTGRRGRSGRASCSCRIRIPVVVMIQLRGQGARQIGGGRWHWRPRARRKSVTGRSSSPGYTVLSWRSIIAIRRRRSMAMAVSMRRRRRVLRPRTRWVIHIFRTNGLAVRSIEAHIPVGGAAAAAVQRVSWHESLGLRRDWSEDAFLRETGAVGAAAVLRFEAGASDLYHVIWLANGSIGQQRLATRQSKRGRNGTAEERVLLYLPSSAVATRNCSSLSRRWLWRLGIHVRTAPIVRMRRSSVVVIVDDWQPVVRWRRVHSHVCSMVDQRGKARRWLPRQSVIAFYGHLSRSRKPLTPPACDG
jgi:hypothetical protein